MPVGAQALMRPDQQSSLSISFAALFPPLQARGCTPWHVRTGRGAHNTEHSQNLFVRQKMAEHKQRVFQAIQALLEDTSKPVCDTTPLLGDGSVLDSMKLVELCLTLEDIATELHFEFDWRSETALSRSRSMFRTAGSLATEFLAQMERAT